MRQFNKCNLPCNVPLAEKLTNTNQVYCPLGEPENWANAKTLVNCFVSRNADCKAISMKFVSAEKILAGKLKRLIKI